MTTKPRFNLRAAVYLVLMKNQQILLLKRHNTGWQDGNYSLCSGHIDGGEPVTAAMIREAKEEIGITIQPSDLEVVHVMHRLSSDAEYIDFFLTARAWQGEPQNMELDKCSEVRWFKLDNLPKNTIENIVQALECVEKGVGFSEFGF